MATIVILLDRISEVDHRAVIDEGLSKGWQEDLLVDELQVQAIASSRDNQKIVYEVRSAVVIQLVIAAASGIVATIGLFTPS